MARVTDVSKMESAWRTALTGVAASGVTFARRGAGPAEAVAPGAGNCDEDGVMVALGRAATSVLAPS